VAPLVWFVVGISLWHFTVWVPDRFWGGIVGAFCGAIAGAMASGAILQIAAARTVGDTDFVTVLAAIPGALVGLAAIYLIGLRADAVAGIER
jgi:hypothetical protein